MKDYFLSAFILISGVIISAAPLLPGIPPPVGFAQTATQRVGGSDSPGTADLIFWLSMDEGTGTSADDAHVAHDFTLTNATWDGTGKVGGDAVSFDGTGDHISSDATINLGTPAQASVSFWVRFDTNVGGQYSVFEIAASPNDTDGSLSILQNGDDVTTRIQDSVASGKYRAERHDAVASSTGVWYHLVVMWDGTANSNAGDTFLYRNGTEYAGTVTTNTKDQHSGFVTDTHYMGQRGGSSLDWAGDIDEFAFFDRLLTEAEITWLYNEGNGRAYSDL